jgi:phosphoglycerate dehydrogenase-like enzyme
MNTLPIVAVPRADIREALSQCEGVELRLWTPDKDPVAHFQEDIGRVEVVIWPYPTPQGIDRNLYALPNLQLVQIMTAGVDSALPYVPPGVTVTNAAGVHATSTSEMALTLVLAKRRQIDVLLGQQQRREWISTRQPSLADSRVLIIGAGNIGTAIASRLKPFEVEVSRVGRTRREDANGLVHGVAELPELLPLHDIVILITPLTDETKGLVDADFLASMPDGALLVNMARGGLVDTDALLAEVNSGRIQAALDVTDPEPLPQDHPLWTAKGVIVTPHVGGSSVAGVPRLHALLRKQISRFVAGEELLNKVPEPGR